MTDEPITGSVSWKLSAAAEEIERLQQQITTLTTLLKAASYHVEGDGEGGAALLVKIRAALEPKP